MKWGDYIEGEPLVEIVDIIDDMGLLMDQAIASFPFLEGFDINKPYTIGWYIEQEPLTGNGGEQRAETI